MSALVHPAVKRPLGSAVLLTTVGVDEEDGSEGRGGLGGGDIGPGVEATAGVGASAGVGIGACTGAAGVCAEGCDCARMGFRGGNRGLGGFAGAFPLAALALGLNSKMNWLPVLTTGFGVVGTGGLK